MPPMQLVTLSSLGLNWHNMWYRRKKIGPLQWDLSVAEHLQPGESYDEVMYLLLVLCHRSITCSLIDVLQAEVCWFLPAGVSAPYRCPLLYEFLCQPGSMTLFVDSLAGCCQRLAGRAWHHSKTCIITRPACAGASEETGST